MFAVVPRFDRLRSVVELEIQRLYRRRYGAVLESFAPMMVAELTQAGTVECVAGLRFGHEPLFLECYLDRPIEQVLEHHLCSEVERSRIVEVCHLAGAGSGRSLTFLRKLIAMLEATEVESAIFTATRPVRHLLRRSGLSLVELGLATIHRVPRPETWGSYFEHDPRIMAVVARTAIGALKRPFTPIVRHRAIDARVF
jgi:thermostable hemolysin